MIDGLRIKMCAQMRLAYNHACVTFPKVDPYPITTALWQVYAAVALELGSTYPLGSLLVKEEIARLTELAIDQIIARSELFKATSGMTPMEKRQFSSVGMGLDQATAMHLYRYRQQYRTDFIGLSVKRRTALESRRNILANQMVDIVAEQAHATMSQIDRGEIQNS